MVEEELWNIFTFYSLYGNPLDPEYLSGSQFIKCVRHSKILEIKDIDAATVNVLYTREVKKHASSSSSKARSRGEKLSYDGFLNALMNLAIKAYPGCGGVDESFKLLLVENVLKLASRRHPTSIQEEMNDPEVQGILQYYTDAFRQIFSFYASEAHDNDYARKMISRRKSSSGASDIMASSDPVLITADDDGASATSSVRKKKRGKSNSMTEALSYKDFLKFAMDFHLSSTVILSSIEIGDIYLTVIRNSDGSSQSGKLRKLTFSEFLEAIMRCAITAYSKISEANIADKLRGLFLYMWRAINKTVPKALEGRKSTSTYGGDLMRGAMVFNNKFTAAWSADGFRDYLSPEPVVAEPARVILSRLTLDSKMLPSTSSTRTLLDAIKSNQTITAANPELKNEALSSSDVDVSIADETE